MPERPTRLNQVEAHDLYLAALGTGEMTAHWLPPEPEDLAPHFPEFEIEALIARGGMGAVYRARQLSLNRTVAIKLLPFDLSVREDFAERFRREASALARLAHPNIVAVHDFGQADDGHYFMVMELVDGSDLATRLKNCGVLPPEEAVRIVRQVCNALHYAHERGVVHRDIKPGNILLDAEGNAKVSDFGIAQLAYEEATGNFTVTGTLLGTPDYTAPEQFMPLGQVDQRADIYSVGVMLYELLTGHLPRGVFRPVSELAPVGRRLDAVLARAMQSEPERRYSGVMELSAELVNIRPVRNRRIVWGIISAVFVALLSASAWWWQEEPSLFTNSLGLSFVPAGTPGVLFSTTETRVRDFEAFDRMRGSMPDAPVYVNYDGTQSGWIQKDASWRFPTFPQAPDHPVVTVSQFEAVAFCEWLTQHERASGRIGAMDQYRLPTDPEWSVAAGLHADAHDPAGTYPWGSDFPPPVDAGNYAGEELREDPLFAQRSVVKGRSDRHRFTAPVGSYTPNRYGLYDMGGNASEWVQNDTRGPAPIRGSSWWDSPAASLDSGHRDMLGKAVRSFAIGFRIVLEHSSSVTDNP